MEYFYYDKPKNSSKRLRIGFLDDNANDDYHSQIMMGIFEAGKKNDVDILRFGYYSSHIAYKFTQQVSMVLEHIEQYDLDGLIFLGWTKAGAMYNYDDFTSRFSSIPLLSIATGFEKIPSVYFMGNLYLKKLIIHLIKKHNRRRIVYISPVRPDNRTDIYEVCLKENNIYDPNLFIAEEDLEGLDNSERAKRVIEILLDERKIKFDAIISLYEMETETLINCLKERGFQIPKDIAVVSYGDSELGRYSSPSFTTIYFPWLELGYHSCVRMVELLRTGRIPFETIVPGKIIYRNSCGCMSDCVNSAGNIAANQVTNTLLQITTKEKGKILQALEKHLLTTQINFEKLLDAFLIDYEEKTNNYFLYELNKQLREVTHEKNYTELEDTISFFRKLILPYILKDQKAILWSGDLFLQGQTMVSDKVFNIHGYENITGKMFSQKLQEISQNIIANFNMETLLTSLELGLLKLNIPNCYLILFNKSLEEGLPEDNLFNNCTLIFEYSNNIRSKNTNHKDSAKNLLKELLLSKGKSYARSAHLLHVTDEIMGFVTFEPGPSDERIYQALSSHISTALRGILLLNKLEFAFKKLIEQAQREGMADIAVDILHNIGNLMNSITVSACTMRDISNSTTLKDVINALELLKVNIERLENFLQKDKKGKILLDYLLKLGSPILSLQNQLLYNVERLTSKVNSIKEIIIAQQNYAGVNTMLEYVDITSVIEDVLKVNSISLEKYNITVTKDYRANPNVMVQRINLFHVLVNLINNAKEAMLHTPIEQKEISFTLTQDKDFKYLMVTDKGCGITADNLKHIFEYGYTTKPDSLGIGLYSSTSYIQGMNGSIMAESPSIDGGATFTLKFKNIDR